MEETKNKETATEPNTTENSSTQQKPITSTHAEKEDAPATIDERLTKMEDESMKADVETNTAVETKEAEKDTVPEPVLEIEPTLTQEVLPETTVSPEPQKVTEEEAPVAQSNKNLTAGLAGMVIGGLLVYLLF